MVLCRNLGTSCTFASGEIENHLTTKKHMNAFIRGVYGKARTPKKEAVFSPTKGLLIDKLPELGPTYILSEKVSSNWPRIGKGEIC